VAQPARRLRELTRGERNCAWIEAHCRIPEGALVGKPVKLTPEQRSWICLIYDSPTRRFILSMGRKNAKTALAAFLLLLHLVGPEARENSQLFSAAQSREQAAVLFKLAAKIVRFSPDLSAYVAIKDSSKVLVCEELGTEYRALSADASTAMGLSPVFVVHDELGQTRGPTSPLYEALETASAAQESPLSIIISTQAPTDADLLSVLIDDALKSADPRTKVVLYRADDMADPFSEEAIRQANPHYDVFMNKEEVREQAEAARRMPSQEAGYRNLILNQRIDPTAMFVSRSVWESNGAAPRSTKGRPVYGGLDLSSVSDLTALVLVSEEGGEYDVEPTFWLPEQGLAEKSRSDRVPYDVWHRQGFLQATPGASISYDFVAQHLRGVFDRYDVRRFAFDRYNMKFLTPCLVRAGFTEAELARFESFGQGMVSMSPALRELETLLLRCQLRHGKHPVLTMCAANAALETDAAENRKFTKKKSTGRIDGMVALAMAIGVARIGAEPERDPEFRMFVLG
jgi:phage terminase large subunit-like protein